MIRIELCFLAGRYAATPPDHHPNEGLAEWPPSPWRLVRALLSTGFSRLGWSDPPKEAVALVQALAAAAPSYRLPSGPTLGHTRHYGPDRALRLDPFVALDPRSPIEVAFPSAASGEALDLLDRLLERLAYLGRASCWVAARRLRNDPATKGVLVQPSMPSAPPGTVPLELLAPLPAESYAAWRNRSFEPERPPRSVPADLLSALRLDPEAVGAGRWSQPPGSRWVGYDIPSAALPSVWAKRPAVRLSVPPSKILAFAVPSAPLTGALRLAERVHESIARQARASRVDVRARLLGLSASGHPLVGHRHLHLLPIHRKNRQVGLLAHLPAGFTEDAAFTLAAAIPGPEIDLPVAPLGPARRWRSLTPILLPRHPRRGRDGPIDQIRAALVRRGLPSPDSIELWDGAELRARQFFRFARSRAKTPAPLPRPYGATLTFHKPVLGPVALGYGCHFGLGHFVADGDSSSEIGK